jgi:ssDNA-binding Zn-finger/Zn-ribbon topoisomerase 1
MSETTNQECPLCSVEAEYYKVDYGHFKYFHCPKCTYYQISDQAERKLENAPEDWKQSLSKKAQDTPEDRLMVLRVDGSTKDLESPYLPKSECSL